MKNYIGLQNIAKKQEIPKKSKQDTRQHWYILHTLFLHILQSFQKILNSFFIIHSIVQFEYHINILWGKH